MWDAESGFEALLTQGRRALSIFQHHDGIAGTAKDHVMKDYAKMMVDALKSCRFVIQQAAYRYLTNSNVRISLRSFVAVVKPIMCRNSSNRSTSPTMHLPISILTTQECPERTIIDKRLLSAMKYQRNTLCCTIRCHTNVKNWSNSMYRNRL